MPYGFTYLWNIKKSKTEDLRPREVTSGYEGERVDADGWLEGNKRAQQQYKLITGTVEPLCVFEINTRLYIKDILI